jgi:hypothetical protein
MTGRPRRAACVLLAGAMAAAIAWAGRPASASALPIGDCTTTSGVVVAVDFAHWGGPVLRSCGTTPTTGYALLNQGGWQTAGTEHDGPGFICRIGYSGYDGGTMFPTAAEEACVLTPPASAYWAFWEAGPGQDTWSYSQSGAMGAVPAPGSVELWVFGSTNLGGTAGSAVPTFSPASVRALNAAPAGAAPAGPGGTPAPTHTTYITVTPSRAAAPASASASRQAALHASPSSPAVVDAPPVAAASHAGRGSPVPALVTLVIVVLLAGGGITAAARRPRRERQPP